MTGLGQPFRVAVAGAGMVTQFHLPGWQKLAGVEVVAICDRELSRAETRAQQFGIPVVFDDLTEMLEAARPDVLDIALPPEAHPGALRLAARYGVHVLCQKPLASTLAEAEALLRDLPGDCRVMVHENWRWRAPWRALKALIDGGAIGRPVSFGLEVASAGLLPDADGRRPALERQPFFAELERFLVIEVLVHHFDALSFLLGPVSVAGARLASRSGAIRGEDSAAIALTAGETVGTLVSSFAAAGAPPLPQDQLVVHGDRASARLEGWSVTCSDPQVPAQSWRYDEAYPSSYAAAIAHFVQCLRSGAPFETGLEEGLAALRAVEAVYAAST